MSKAIWKFEFQVEPEFTLNMPMGAKILCIQKQFDTPCIWAEVDTNAMKVQRRFYLVGTGHALPENAISYRGTFQEVEGMFIWHLYDGVEYI